MEPDRMLKWFAWDHLPAELRPIARKFEWMAQSVTGQVPPGPERTVALRKLLEARDAAVRATVHPGG